MVCRRRDDLIDIVFLTCALTADSAAAPVLALIVINELSLDITEVRERYDDILFLDERLVIDLLESAVYDLRYTRRSVLTLDLKDLFLDRLVEDVNIVEDEVVVSDSLLKFLDLLDELLTLETCETTESHVYDMLSLLIGESESLAHYDLCIILCS